MENISGFMSNPYGPQSDALIQHLAMTMDPAAAANQLGPLMGQQAPGSVGAGINQGWENMIYGAGPTQPAAGPQGQPFQMSPQTAAALNGMVPKAQPGPGAVAPRTPNMGPMQMYQAPVVQGPQLPPGFAAMLGRR